MQSFVYPAQPLKLDGEETGNQGPPPPTTGFFSLKQKEQDADFLVQIEDSLMQLETSPAKLQIHYPMTSQGSRGSRLWEALKNIFTAPDISSIPIEY